MLKARYQQKLTGNTVRCLVCPHCCTVHEGKYGLCKTRVNKQGELYSLVYGTPCSLSVDPIEKKPLFHFYPGSRIFSLATAGCNLHCLNCQNWQISQLPADRADHYNLLPKEVVEQAIQSGTDSIAFTYTEPTVFYEYMYDIAKIAHEQGLKTVLVSNGYINEAPLMDLLQYLDAANIDLKCFDDSVYYKLTGGHLQPVLDTLKRLKDNGIWLEITNLLVPTISDDISTIRIMCKWLKDNGFEDNPLHFSRFFPTHKLTDLPPTPEALLIQAKEIADEERLKYVYIGNLPRLHGENTMCPKCKKMLVERIGYGIKNNFIRNGLCSFCGEPIAGRWQ